MMPMLGGLLHNNMQFRNPGFGGGMPQGPPVAHQPVPIFGGMPPAMPGQMPQPGMPQPVGPAMPAPRFGGGMPQGPMNLMSLLSGMRGGMRSSY